MSKKQSQRPIRVLALGDGNCSTGFGTVMRNVLFELATDKSLNLDIDQIAINHHGDFYPTEVYPYRMYPALRPGISNDVYGRPRLIQALLGRDKHLPAPYDILFTLQDPFIMEGVVEQIKQCKEAYAKESLIFKWISYWPADGTYKENWADTVLSSDYPIMYTNFGKEQVKYHDIEGKKRADRVRVIYHGTNTKDFFPVGDKEKEDFRKQYFADKVKPNHFLVANVNRNQPRKDIARSMAAFKEFKKLRPDSILYLHMKNQDAGGSISEIARNLKMVEDEDYIIPKVFDEQTGVPLNVLNMIYNVSDLLITTTLGEGWGLCLAPESLILTDKGYKQINELLHADKVLTTEGYKDIRKIISRQNDDGELIALTIDKNSKNDPLKLTKEHPVLTKRGFVQAQKLEKDDEIVIKVNRYTYEENKRFKFDLAEYISGSTYCRTEKQVWIYGSNNKFKRYIDLNKNFAELYGIYLAEGSASKNGIVFSISQDEKEFTKNITELVKKVWNRDVAVEDCKKSKKRWIRVYGNILREFYTSISGTGARNKYIDGEIYKNLSKHTASKLIKGFWLGDGSVEPYGFEITTCSKKLAYGLKDIALRLGMLLSLECNSSRGSYRLRTNKKFASKFSYIVGNQKMISKFIDGGLNSVEDEVIYLGIKDIAKCPHSAEVYDISVDGKPEFQTNHGIVHNSITEAMTTKTPVAAPNITSIPEIFNSSGTTAWNLDKDYSNLRGIPVETDGWFCLGQNDMEQIRPLTSIRDMTAKMIWAYDNPNECKTIADNAYKWVIKLKWSKVCEQWKQVFKEAIKDLEVYYEQQRNAAAKGNTVQPKEAIK